VNDDYTTCNAAAQVATPGSVFEYWRSALALRKELVNIFVYGDFELLDADHEDVFAYSRSNSDQKAVVVCNFREHEITWAVPRGTHLQSAEILLSNYPEVHLGLDNLILRPFEAFVCMSNK
jgi:glycosidase